MRSPTWREVTEPRAPAFEEASRRLAVDEIPPFCPRGSTSPARFAAYAGFPVGGWGLGMVQARSPAREQGLDASRG